MSVSSVLYVPSPVLPTFVKFCAVTTPWNMCMLSLIISWLLLVASIIFSIHRPGTTMCMTHVIRMLLIIISSTIVIGMPLVMSVLLLLHGRSSIPLILLWGLPSSSVLLVVTMVAIIWLSLAVVKIAMVSIVLLWRWPAHLALVL